MPLYPQCALLAVPSGDQADMNLVAASLSNYSVGTAAARRVVLPPGLERNDTLAKNLVALRQRNVELLNTVETSQALTVKMLELTGAALHFDHAGRLQKP